MQIDLGDLALHVIEGAIKNADLISLDNLDIANPSSPIVLSSIEDIDNPLFIRIKRGEMIGMAFPPQKPCEVFDAMKIVEKLFGVISLNEHISWEARQSNEFVLSFVFAHLAAERSEDIDAFRVAGIGFDILYGFRLFSGFDLDYVIHACFSLALFRPAYYRH